MASSSNDITIPLNTLMHMITIKLNSTNYLLWKNQMLPILTYQNLLPHVDGSSTAPPPILSSDDKTVDNPAHSAWVTTDQRTIIILHASLSEEAVTVIVGLPTARQIWVALEHAFGNSCIDRVHNLRDQLRLLQKGSKSIAEFGRSFFKSFCDQLAAVGHPVDDADQVHWFLCGLGSPFETFFTAILSTQPASVFSDLLARVESHELFMRNLHGSPTPPVAFNVQATRPFSPQGRGGRSTHGSHYNTNRGGRSHGRRPPTCQLCHQDGHFASQCLTLTSYASHVSPAANDESLASAFLSQCHVASSTPDWFVDSGATDHMTPSSSNVSNPTPTKGSTNQGDPSPGHV